MIKTESEPQQCNFHIHALHHHLMSRIHRYTVCVYMCIYTCIHMHICIYIYIHYTHIYTHSCVFKYKVNDFGEIQTLIKDHLIF